ncbi:MAG: 50S ribosomal protein L31 type B [Chlamydiae bacterium]|nr:50S ribosomal protein L31 type B [Chlamydiota bacterium]
MVGQQVFKEFRVKKDTHPPYQDVLYVDTSTGHKFVIGSPLQLEATEEFEGKEYPVYHVTVSSASHPFFTGSKQFVDSEGRVDKFMKRYARKSEQHKQNQERPKKEEPKKPKKASRKK